jgi:heptosyltransferase-2
MKILVIQQKMIGDVLTSSILFEALRKEFPEAELHYLIYPHTIPVVKNNPHIDRIIPFDTTRSFYSYIREVKNSKYHAVIDVYAIPITALITGLSGAKFRISYEKWYTRPFCTHLFSQNIDAQTPAGASIEKRLRLLSPLSSNFPAEIKPKIYLDKEELTQAQQLLKTAEISSEKPLYMISVLGSSQNKTYPPKYLAELLDCIVEQREAELLFNYIPSQKEDAERLFQLCNPFTKKRIHLQIFGKSLREFISLTSQCDALIGNEGGAVNIAKALNIPTFAIFSPQIPKENWNSYEDGINHTSVHLKDFYPDAFDGYTDEDVAKKASQFYELLKPKLIFANLKNFTEKHP